MGRATVVSETGAGLYTVDVTYNRADADARVAKLTATAAAIRSGQLPGLQAALDAAVVLSADAAAALTTALGDYQAAQAAQDDVAIAAAFAALGVAADLAGEAQAAVIRAGGDYNSANLRAAALDRQAASLSARLTTGTSRVDAWCADYTEGLTGSVGTIEVGHIGVVAPILHPGGELGTGAAYSAARDGELTQTMSALSEVAFHSLAILPGLNKWRPRYRLGTLTAVDTSADTVAVTLDAATTPHQTLSMNQSASLSAVPADYMGTGADLYGVGDRVVVGFSDDLVADPTRVGSWTRPYVVGFESNPIPPVQEVVKLYDGFTWVPPGAGPWVVELHTNDYDSGGYTGWRWLEIGQANPAIDPTTGQSGWGYTFNDRFMGLAAERADAVVGPAFASGAGGVTVQWSNVPQSVHDAPPTSAPRLLPLWLKTTAADSRTRTYDLSVPRAWSGAPGATINPRRVAPYPVPSGTFWPGTYWFGYSGSPGVLSYQWLLVGEYIVSGGATTWEKDVP